MGELFCKLEDQVYVLLLSCRVCLDEICLKFYFAYLVLQLLERTFQLRLCLFVENIIFPEKMSHHRDSDGDKMGEWWCW